MTDLPVSDALNAGVLALNTHTEPGATNDTQSAWLDQNAAPAVATLTVLRDALDRVDADDLRSLASRPADGWEHPAHLPGVTVSTYYGEADGVPVVQVDTGEEAPRVRINLNDGPVWDGVPEFDTAPGRFVVAHEGATGRNEHSEHVLGHVLEELAMTELHGQVDTAADYAADVAARLHREYGVTTGDVSAAASVALAAVNLMEKWAVALAGDDWRDSVGDYLGESEARETIRVLDAAAALTASGAAEPDPADRRVGDLVCADCGTRRAPFVVSAETEVCTRCHAKAGADRDAVEEMREAVADTLDTPPATA